MALLRKKARPLSAQPLAYSGKMRMCLNWFLPVFLLPASLFSFALGKETIQELCPQASRTPQSSSPWTNAPLLPFSQELCFREEHDYLVSLVESSLNTDFYFTPILEKVALNSQTPIKYAWLITSPWKYLKLLKYWIKNSAFDTPQSSQDLKKLEACRGKSD